MKTAAQNKIDITKIRETLADLIRQNRCGARGHNFCLSAAGRSWDGKVEYHFKCSKCTLDYYRIADELTAEEKKCVDSCFGGA